MSDLDAFAVGIGVNVFPVEKEPIIRTPPYDFADDCTQTSEFGDGVALVSSDVATGKTRVQARATKVGQAISRGGWE